MSVAVIHVNMAEFAKIDTTRTRANVCRDILGRIARLISMIARPIRVGIEDRALIKLTVINAFVVYHILDVIAIRKWILVCPTDVEMARNVHQAPIIWTFPAVATWDTQVDYAMKTLMSVPFLVRVATELPAKIQTDHTNAFALKAMKVAIALLTPTIALLIPVRMAEVAWMASEITRAFASMASKESTVKRTLTNVCPIPAKMEQHAISMSTVTLAHVLLASPA